MKRIIALMLTLILMLSMAACTPVSVQDNTGETNSIPTNQGQNPGPSEPSTEQNPNPSEPSTEQTPETNKPEVTYKKLEGQITGASVFNDGYALVCVNGDKDTTYCIDKQGNIIYQIDEKLAINGTIYKKVINGHLLTNKGIYDMTGKLTNPEAVGATKFYDIAFAGGYILAEKVTADYSGTKKELGIMNMSFEWVVEPTKEIYTAAEASLSWLTVTNTQSYYVDGFIYFKESDCYLNVTTGAVVASINQKMPSEQWDYSTNGKYVDYNQNIMLDISHYTNIKLVVSAKFKNGKAPVFFRNVDAGIWFFTFVDEEGKFLFDPVQIKDMTNVGKASFDGQYLLVSNSSSENSIHCYNTQGELVGTYYNKTSVRSEIVDGIILISSGTMTSPKREYFNPDFTPLF